MGKAKPLIGVAPLWDGERESIWMLPGYLDCVTGAGGIPLVLPLRAEDKTLEQLVRALDGFLFTGGHDLDPARYGEETAPVCGELCPARDSLEWRLLDLVLASGKPLLGICRGLQLLNVVLGGTLYQHLPEQLPGAPAHRMVPPYDRPAHEVRLLPGTRLHRLLRAETLAVNSCHHQGIKQLAPGLIPAAEAPDSLIEAVELPGPHFALAVQWHPEFMPKSEDSLSIFSSFVSAAGGTAEFDG